MKRFAFILILISSVLISCDNEDTPDPGVPAEQTLLMYLPWSGNLLPYFENNIKDLETAVSQDILEQERILVFFSSSPTESALFELKYKKGKCVRDTLQTYLNHPFTTAGGITTMLNDMMKFAPAERYALAINCHGMAWVPVSDARLRSGGEKEYWEYGNGPLTRYFGGTQPEHQTDITTLAKGIKDAGIKMEYIMFDDCYMSSIEVAYDLKEVAGHLIASPCEVLAHGMPYDQVAKYMVGEVDYASLCDTYLAFYQNYEDMPCGTIAVINCAEMDNLAGVMREINSQFTFNTSLLSHIQRLDGYSPTRFYDYGDYVSKLCTDPSLLATFGAQFERTVPSRYRLHTEYFYTMSQGKIKINTYSGVTTSDPSISSVTAAKTETAWYKATH